MENFEILVKNIQIGDTIKIGCIETGMLKSVVGIYISHGRPALQSVVLDLEDGSRLVLGPDDSIKIYV